MTSEIIPFTQLPYAFTYKILGASNATFGDYSTVVERLTRYGHVKMLEQETDSEGLLHIHGIILLRKGFFIKRFLTIEGFHMHIKPIYDETGWTRYLQKQYSMEYNLFDGTKI